MRPVVLGRKNWLHVGSEKSGPKVGAILSVVECCRRLGIPVKDYLPAVLRGMNQRKLSLGSPRPDGTPPAPDLDWPDGYADLAKHPANSRHFVIQSTGGKHGDSWIWPDASNKFHPALSWISPGKKTARPGVGSETGCESRN